MRIHLHVHREMERFLLVSVKERDRKSTRNDIHSSIADRHGDSVYFLVSTWYLRLCSTTFGYCEFAFARLRIKKVACLAKLLLMLQAMGHDPRTDCRNSNTNQDLCMLSVNNDGYLTALLQLLRTMGWDPTDAEITDMVAELDDHDVGAIQ